MTKFGTLKHVNLFGVFDEIKLACPQSDDKGKLTDILMTLYEEATPWDLARQELFGSGKLITRETGDLQSANNNKAISSAHVAIRAESFLNEIAEAAAFLSKIIDAPVHFKFNGIPLIATSETTPLTAFRQLQEEEKKYTRVPVRKELQQQMAGGALLENNP